MKYEERPCHLSDKGLTLEDIMGGVSQPRNMVIANVFYRLQLIESYGTGIQKIVESYAGSGRAPSFAPAPASFVVVLPNRNTGTGARFDPKESNEENVLRLLQTKREVSRKEVEQFLGCSAFPAGKALKELMAQGRIEKVGTGRSTRYRLVTLSSPKH